MEQQVDKIYDRLNKTRYSGDHKIHDDHQTYYANNKSEEEVKKFIKEKLEAGYSVKAGWVSTSIKGITIV